MIELSSKAMVHLSVANVHMQEALHRCNQDGEHFSVWKRPASSCHQREAADVDSRALQSDVAGVLRRRWPAWPIPGLGPAFYGISCFLRHAAHAQPQGQQ